MIEESAEPNWLEMEMILDIHAEQIARFGGPDGVRNSGLLESALKPKAEVA